MNAERNKDRSLMVVVCYGLLALISFVSMAHDLYAAQNGSLQAMWWELTESDASVSYGLFGSATLLQVVIATLSFRFTRRPKAARLAAVIGSISFSAIYLVGLLICVVLVARPDSFIFKDLRGSLSLLTNPFVILLNLIVTAIYCFCAYELLRLTRTSNHRLERP
jgi:hypothetical protein